MPLEPEKLLEQVTRSLSYSWDRHRTCLFWNNVTVWCAAGLGVLVVAAGAFDHAKLAAVVGAATSGLLLLQKNYRFAENAYFWEQRHNQAKTIRDRLRYLENSQDDYRSILEDWIRYRQNFLEGKPTPGVQDVKGD